MVRDFLAKGLDLNTILIAAIKSNLITFDKLYVQVREDEVLLKASPQFNISWMLPSSNKTKNETKKLSDQ